MEFVFDFVGIAVKVGLVAMLMACPVVLLVRANTHLRLQSFKAKVRTGEQQPRVFGFFHPFCDAMGGGEKVLFQAINAI